MEELEFRDLTHIGARVWQPVTIKNTEIWSIHTCMCALQLSAYMWQSSGYCCVLAKLHRAYQEGVSLYHLA